MANALPVIVGFGGYSAAGRSSSHQAFRRMILESLPTPGAAEHSSQSCLFNGSGISGGRELSRSAGQSAQCR